jgi:AraC-like DNA-binding protein
LEKRVIPRQAHTEQIIDQGTGRPRGLLQWPPPEGQFRYVRRLPAPELTPWVAHFWMVSWDLRGLAPYRPETLPHPNVHVVFEEGASQVNGVSTSRFTRLLEGQSQVFGIKFKPGGFRPILRKPVSTITNRSLPAQVLLGPIAGQLEALTAQASSDAPLVEAAGGWLRSVLPAPDPVISEVDRLVTSIREAPEILTVDGLAGHTGIGKRSLQRLFREYVGVPPKWVIRRYRLHELVERLNAGARLNWSQVALDLGYFDQAHLVNDFRSVTGYRPSQYLRQIGSAAQTIAGGESPIGELSARQES